MTQLYQITPGLAQARQMPQWFVAVQLAESNKAVYVYGHGQIEPIIIDCWIPKSCIIETHNTIEVVEVPSDHPMVLRQKILTRYATLAQTIRGNNIIKVQFPFAQDDLNFIRTISGRRFNTTEKYWTIPLTIENIKKLQAVSFSIGEPLQEILTRHNIKVEQLQQCKIPNLKGTLFPYQNTGVSWLEIKNGCAILGDDMGLGKTVQALAWLLLHTELRPALVICPATLKINWQREAVKWLPDPNVLIIRGTNYQTINHKGIIIINYDILPNKYKTIVTPDGKKIKQEIPYSGWVDYIVDLKPQVMIVDECHYIKHDTSLRTKAVKKLGRYIPHRIPMSGTLIENCPDELYNPVHLADPTLLGNRRSFRFRHCAPKYNGFGWDYSGASNLGELHEKLKTIMIRRTKEEVLPELPPRMSSYIPLELDNINEYKTAEQNIQRWLISKISEEFKVTQQKILNELGTTMKKYQVESEPDEQFFDDQLNVIIKGSLKRFSKAETVIRFEYLKQIAVKGILSSAITWVQDFLLTGKKLIIFAQHRSVITTLEEAFPKQCVKIIGGMTDIAKQKSVDKFQNTSIPLCLANIKAGGLGLNLTATSNVVFLELPWNSKILDQAIDRVRRIGQLYCTNIYYLFAMNTVMDRLVELIDSRHKVADTVLDGKVTDTESLLSELIKSYVEPNTQNHGNNSSA